MKKIAIFVIALIIGFSAAIPGQAAPVFVPSNPDTRYTVQNVQWNGDRRWRPNRHNWHGHYGHHRPSYHRPWRQHNRPWHHHRRHNSSNAAAVLGGLAAGAIIGGAIAQSQQPRYELPQRDLYGDRHVSWCFARYRSYRAFDNTFQPFNGPRQQCFSPH